MSYQTYTTDAIVCGSYLNGLADKSYLLFTREAGMVYASARSVREERSRQRYALQDFSLITVSLVKGKGGWRIGSVQVHNNLYSDMPTRDARGTLVRYVKHLRRYISGELADVTLYEEVLTCVAAIRNIPTGALEAYECIAYARLLTRLGYIAPPASVASLLLAKEYAVPDIDPYNVIHIGQLITAAEAVSHL